MRLASRIPPDVLAAKMQDIGAAEASFRVEGIALIGTFQMYYYDVTIFMTRSRQKLEIEVLFVFQFEIEFDCDNLL